MVSSIVPANNLRRDVSKAPVGFVFLFLTTAMVSLLVLVSVFLAWTFPSVFAKVVKSEKTECLPSLLWYLVASAVMIIITFAARLPGWAIFAIILFVVILSFLGMYVYVVYFKKKRGLDPERKASYQSARKGSGQSISERSDRKASADKSDDRLDKAGEV